MLADLAPSQENFSLDLPGFEAKDVEITLEKGILHILAKNEKRRREEFFTVEDVDVEKISAKLERGVLELKLPRKEECKPRRIEVK